MPICRRWTCVGFSGLCWAVSSEYQMLRCVWCLWEMWRFDVAEAAMSVIETNSTHFLARIIIYKLRCTHRHFPDGSVNREREIRTLMSVRSLCLSSSIHTQCIGANGIGFKENKRTIIVSKFTYPVQDHTRLIIWAISEDKREMNFTLFSIATMWASSRHENTTHNKWEKHISVFSSNV